MRTIVLTLPVRPTPLRMKNRQINLLPIEELLERLLLDCRATLPSSKAASELELRFTGGWVRDKLLGIQSHDVDVALSSMTGMQFGAALEQFVSKEGAKYEQEAKELGVSSGLKSLHQIAANPEKSKHLETVTTKIFGLDVDLVNLRKETYSEDSRNPQMEFGTPEEDALRRDATVNALFYNLHTEQIEDFTSHGLDDMAAGIIRTPLEPHQTFMDDPLRVLRLIRFASKLGYTIDHAARSSMADPRIHKALKEKISRERVGVEVLKMINGGNPLMAFQTIWEMDLFATVFTETRDESIETLRNSLPDSRPTGPWPPTWPHAYELLTALLDDSSELGRTLTRTETDAESLWLMAAYAPLLSLTSEKVVEHARYGIKATNKISKLLEKATWNNGVIVDMINKVAKEGTASRSTIGMALRSWGTSWRTQVLYALLAKAVTLDTTDGFFEEQIGLYRKFVETIAHLNLQDAAIEKPLLNGNEIQEAFQVQKSGPWMKNALDYVSKWQFDHPNGSKDEAQAWLLQHREALNVS